MIDVSNGWAAYLITVAVMGIYQLITGKKLKENIMDNKIKLFAVASVVAVMASGCTGYNGYNNQDTTTGSTGYSSGSGVSQNSGAGQVANNRNTCTPCTTKPKATYTYKPRTVVKPKPRTVYKPAVQAKGQYNQKYYIDRWNRQQNQARTKTVVRNTNTSANYGSGYYKPNTASSTTYYDYSSAGRSNNTGSLSTSNKSIYTGSYQKKTYKPYKPTTYASGASNTTYTSNKTTYKPAATSYSGGSSNGSSYTVKKGDTVFEIMRQTGVYWKDIIRLNNLQAPYNINPGQRIRLK